MRARACVYNDFVLRKEVVEEFFFFFFFFPLKLKPFLNEIDLNRGDLTLIPAPFHELITHGYKHHQAEGPPDCVGEAQWIDYFQRYTVSKTGLGVDPFFVGEFSKSVVAHSVIVHHGPPIRTFHMIEIHSATPGCDSDWLSASCWIEVFNSEHSFNERRQIRPNGIHRIPIAVGDRQVINGVRITFRKPDYTPVTAPTYLDAIGVEYQVYAPLIRYTPNPALLTPHSVSFSVRISDETGSSVVASLGVSVPAYSGLTYPTPLSLVPVPVASGGYIDLEMPPPPTKLLGSGLWPIITVPPSEGTVVLLYSPGSPMKPFVPPSQDSATDKPAQFASQVITNSNAHTSHLRHKINLYDVYPGLGAVGTPNAKPGFSQRAWAAYDGDETFKQPMAAGAFGPSAPPLGKLCIGFDAPVYPWEVKVGFYHMREKNIRKKRIKKREKERERERERYTDTYWKEGARE